MTSTGVSATGDMVTGTAVNYLVMGLPVATAASPVSGPACTGVVTQTTCVKLLMKGLPSANITSVATGVNPATGVPVTTPAAVSTAIKYIC